ncbi:lipase family protein, partial [Ottowia sp.]|uniref:lipase family protein n=1 Tax=Ottowia sp. TaxID=1898956 RepID=UPI003A891EFE
MLGRGNDRTSRFTPTDAAWFAQSWEVLEHTSNTVTGFSGTLFKAKVTDEARGIVAGELVLSFRSTEFVDDAARDNQATNNLEISDKGWAFGQIADMEEWFGELKASGTLDPAASINVTGYSLGGHLATAFNLLHQNDLTAMGAPLIGQTYTFSGAGVGKLKDGASLQDVLNVFTSVRNGGADSSFVTIEVRDLYQRIKTALGASPNEAALEAALEQVRKAILNTADSPLYTDAYRDLLRADYTLLNSALKRAEIVAEEVVRVAGLTVSAGVEAPLAVGTEHIAAVGLDYQLGVVLASRQTEAYPVVGIPWDETGLDNTLFDERNTMGPIAGFYDIYASNYPSAVANSQLHYGTPQAVIVEDQPLIRGNYASQVGWASITSGFDFKLLVNNFDRNDFGDTHSLVLMVDSLSVQNVLAQLDSSFDTEKFVPIMQAATNTTGGSSVLLPTQGTAEGDALDNIVNALARMFNAGATELKGDTRGNTWYERDTKDGYTGRNALHAVLEKLTNNPAFTALAGTATVTAASGYSNLETYAKTDFGVFLALQNLSPVVISTTGASALAALKSAHSDLSTAWQTDMNARLYGDTSYVYTYTDQWYTDRAAMLDWLTEANQ